MFRILSFDISRNCGDTIGRNFFICSDHGVQGACNEDKADLALVAVGGSDMQRAGYAKVEKNGVPWHESSESISGLELKAPAVP